MLLIKYSTLHLCCLQACEHPLGSDYLLFPMVEAQDGLGAYPASLLLVCPAGKVLLHFDSQASDRGRLV